MKFNVITGLCLAVTSILFLGCSIDDSTINPAYTLTEFKNDSNVDTLRKFQLAFSALKKSDSALSSIEEGLKKFNAFALDGHAIKAAELVQELPMVNLKDSIAKMFDPENQLCPLPNQVLKKMKKLKENNKSWVPREIALQLNVMPDQTLYMQGFDLPNILHSIKVKQANVSSEETSIIVGAPTYSSLNIADFLSKTINNFAYTLDCSGLLTASIEGTAAVPGNDITSKAKLAMEKKAAMFIGGGVVVSPLYSAFVGNASGVNLSKELRSQILAAIVSMPNMADTDSIELIMSYEVIWASGNGEQSFNGSGDFSSRGGIAIGVAQVSGGVNASGSVSRNCSFSSFNTFLTGRQRLNKPIWVTVRQIKALIKQLSIG